METNQNPPIPYLFVKPNWGQAPHGPGGGEAISGLDGISRYYFYHQKFDEVTNWNRFLALDQFSPMSRKGTKLQLQIAGGGTINASNPSPRPPYDSSRFTTQPDNMTEIVGDWLFLPSSFALVSPATGELRIDRSASGAHPWYTNPLTLPTSTVPETRNFSFDWWLKAESGDPPEGARIDFVFSGEKAREPEIEPPGGEGFSGEGFGGPTPPPYDIEVIVRIRPNEEMLQLVENNITTSVETLIGEASLTTPWAWADHWRRFRFRKDGDRVRAWAYDFQKFDLQLPEGIVLNNEAFVRTLNLPTRLTAYRQTLSFIDDFEKPSASFSSLAKTGYGSWSTQGGGLKDDGYAVQSTLVNQPAFMLGPQAFSEFTAWADVRIQGTTPGAHFNYPALHGIVHNYISSQRFAFFGHEFLANGQEQLVAFEAVPLPLPSTGYVRTNQVTESIPATPYSWSHWGSEFRQFMVVSDFGATGTSRYRYYFCGKEVFTNGYTGLYNFGQAGVMCQNAKIHADNFAMSGW